MTKLSIPLMIFFAFTFGLITGYGIFSDSSQKFFKAQTDYDKTVNEILSRESHFQLRTLELLRELDQCKQQNYQATTRSAK